MNATIPPDGRWPAPPQNETRLESWGEIASYLRRDVRTVQLWERTLELPVRRLHVGKISSVYAYRTELDKWCRERQPLDEHPETQKNLDAPVVKTTKSLGKSEGRDFAGWMKFPKLWQLAMVAVVALAIALGVHYYPILMGHFWPMKPVVGKIRLFVRPFANHSGDPQQAQFIRGLTDETIAQLGRLDPTHLGVIAATSSELLADKSIDELGGLLHVQYILEGSVRRSGTQVRINTDLVQVSDQTHIWADSYTGDMSDISGVQEKVAVAVAKQIHVALPLSLGAIKIDPSAYDAYLKGRSYWASRDLAKSIAAYEQAIRTDPNYGPAYAGLASGYLLVGNVPNDGMPPMVSTPKAREAAQHAILLNPSNAEAHSVLANIAMSFDWDFAAAEREYQRAISLDPNYATAHEWFAHYLIVRNRLTEAQTEMNYALDLDPFSPLFNTARAETFYYARDYDAAISHAKSTLEQYPDFLLARFWLASAYREKKMYPQAIAEFDQMRKQSGNAPAILMGYGHALAVSGDAVGARKALSELEQLSHSRYVPALYFAALYTGLGEKNKALIWLEKAYAEHNDRLIYLGVEPLADPLRREPAFRDLLNRVGLP